VSFEGKSSKAYGKVRMVDGISLKELPSEEHQLKGERKLLALEK